MLKKPKCLEVKTWKATCLTNPFPEGGERRWKEAPNRSAATLLTSEKKVKTHFRSREEVRAVPLPWAECVSSKAGLSLPTRKGSSTHLACEWRKTGWSSQKDPLEIKGFVSTLNQRKAWRSTYKESCKATEKAKAETHWNSGKTDGKKDPTPNFLC